MATSSDYSRIAVAPRGLTASDFDTGRATVKTNLLPAQANVMNQRTILTVEDDSAIRRGVVDALEFAGFRVLEAANGDAGIEAAVRQDYDLLLLDLVLPGKSGLEILREVRRTRPTQPVIILTARGEENDRVEGLRCGADDYVVKPFSVKELLARVEAVLRRSPERPTDVELVELPTARIDCSSVPAPPTSTTSHAAKSSTMTEHVWNCQNARSSCFGIWSIIAVERSRVTSCYRTSGESVRRAFRHARSTCTSRACARNSATSRTSPNYWLPFAAKATCLRKNKCSP